MKRNASPGPDGFNVEFYMAAWSWIGDDVANLVKSFFQSGIMPAHINDTHIVLIPKKLVSQVPADYRPISLFNVVYKIIAKALANRLKSHLPDWCGLSPLGWPNLHGLTTEGTNTRKNTKNTVTSQDFQKFKNLERSKTF